MKVEKQSKVVFLGAKLFLAASVLFRKIANIALGKNKFGIQLLRNKVYISFRQFEWKIEISQTRRIQQLNSPAF